MQEQGSNSWMQYFPNLSPDFRKQKGQIEAFQWASDVSPGTPSSTIVATVSELIELCTGYGKTILAYGVFWILRCRGIVDRMLVLVPTDNQRTQFADDADDARKLLGIDVDAWTIDKQKKEIRGSLG